MAAEDGSHRFWSTVVLLVLSVATALIVGGFWSDFVAAVFQLIGEERQSLFWTPDGFQILVLTILWLVSFYHFREGITRAYRWASDYAAGRHAGRLGAQDLPRKKLEPYHIIFAAGLEGEHGWNCAAKLGHYRAVSSADRWRRSHDRVDARP
jgi:hypothetical protein